MPAFQTKILISNLQQDVRNTLVGMEHLLRLPDDVLLQQPEVGKWSIAQVLEHLNGYNRFYLTEIDKALQDRTVNITPVFKSGRIGNYFTNLMLPKENGTLAKKMSSPKEYNFPPDLDAGRVVQEFMDGQQKLLVLLDKARNVDMGSIRVPISISKWIRLKLGDTFRFLIAHQLRHIIQIERTEKAVLKNKAA